MAHFFCNAPLYECTTVCLSVHQLKDILSWLLQVLAIVSKAAINTVCRFLVKEYADR
jgi:hypothetical protein